MTDDAAVQRRAEIGERRFELSHHEGPIPSAVEVAKWEAMRPGSAERFLTMAEGNLAHHHAMDIAVVKAAADGNRSLWRFRDKGQTAVFVVTITMTIGATVAASLHAPWQAVAAIVSGPALTAALAALAGRSHRELAAKNPPQDRQLPPGEP